MKPEVEAALDVVAAEQGTEKKPTRGKGRVAFAPTKCLTPNCNGQFGAGLPKGHRGGRGLCKACIQQAASLVKRKITTWEELEELGLAQPKYNTLVQKALYEARRKKKQSG